MRQLVMLVCMAGIISLLLVSSPDCGMVPSWRSPGGHLGLTPLVNELSLYKNYDDAGQDRGQTLQIIAINSIRIFTTFNFEFTGDFNWRYSYVDPFDHSLGKNRHDYYLELSLVKPVTSVLSVNFQRIHTTFENKPINQFGFRLSL